MEEANPAPQRRVGETVARAWISAENEILGGGQAPTPSVSPKVRLTIATSTGAGSALALSVPTNPDNQNVQSVGLTFRPDGEQANQSDECQHRLGHDWWAVTDSFGAARPCAPSFYFVGTP